MQVTQQQVRRRGSSLDENAIRAVLAQAPQILRLPEQHATNNDDDDKQSVSSEDPELPSHPKGPISRPDNGEKVKGLFGLILICMLLGACIAAFKRTWDSQPNQNQLTAQIDLAEEVPFKVSSGITQIEACLADIKGCPRFPEKIFWKDWSKRSSVKSKSTCYREKIGWNENCEATCEFLFRKTASESPAFGKIITACQIGCSFAKREHTSEKSALAVVSPNCQWDCKNTVWVFSAGRSKCNYADGLGLATADFEEKYGHGIFGAGKACEIGCILGNSRPCPLCDIEARARTSES